MSPNELADLLDGVGKSIDRQLPKIAKDIGEGIERRARTQLGSYLAGWPQLAATTQSRREAAGYEANQPGLASGEMRDSIGTKVKSVPGRADAHVGSDDPKLKWFELGTVNQPPRPVLVPSTVSAEDDAVAKTVRNLDAIFHGEEL